MAASSSSCSPNSKSSQFEAKPEFGWTVRLDHSFEEQREPFSRPRVAQALKLAGLGVRYSMFWLELKRKKKKPFIDQIHPLELKQIYGVPIGGIGAGTIGRGFRGEFCRFQLIPGMYSWHTVETDQFTVCVRKKGKTVYQQVLSVDRPEKKGLKLWNWAFNGDNAVYHGLYPRSWTTYTLPGQGIDLQCRQVSPVIPEDYKDSSLPAAVFIWNIINNNDEPVDVSIMLTFQNGDGSHYATGSVQTEPFIRESYQMKTSGVLIRHELRDMPCTFGVSAAHHPNCDISCRTYFNPNSESKCKELWMDLMEDGKLEASTESSPTLNHNEDVACAVCVKQTIAERSSGQCTFGLVWDMPVVRFPEGSKSYRRRYTRWFNTGDNNAPFLCSYALSHYHEWEEKIFNWQKPILDDKTLPEWFKSALFNELYFISDGGSIWIEAPAPDSSSSSSQEPEPVPAIVREFGRFAYLEGHEYRMYNTYDVHFYASFALILLWPKLQLSLQYDFARFIQTEDSEKIKYLWNGKSESRKALNCVPHDVGDPEENPWEKVNAYVMHNTDDWKDLNIKFVLQVYRDFVVTGDEQYLEDMWPVMEAVMARSFEQDTDKDGIIDNSGSADQTYDCWTVTGASAYCGGLWLAALKCMCIMAAKMGHDDALYKCTLEKGTQSFYSKLWNGKYFNYDSSRHSHHDSIMADQCAGHWYLRASNIKEGLFDKDKVRSALETVFEFNVKQFADCKMGAVNGMRPNGKQDVSSIQSEEVWTGVTYAVAACMIHEGMTELGFQTARGIYESCYNVLGLGFQTPEAFMKEKYFRSLGYMRPLSIWAMYHALKDERQ